MLLKTCYNQVFLWFIEIVYCVAYKIMSFFMYVLQGLEGDITRSIPLPLESIVWGRISLGALLYETVIKKNVSPSFFCHKTLPVVSLRKWATWLLRLPLTLTLNPPNKLSSASIFKELECRSKLVKMLSECQTAWILMRRRVTRRLIRI